MFASVYSGVYLSMGNPFLFGIGKGLPLAAVLAMVASRSSILLVATLDALRLSTCLVMCFLAFLKQKYISTVNRIPPMNASTMIPENACPPPFSPMCISKNLKPPSCEFWAFCRFELPLAWDASVQELWFPMLLVASWLLEVKMGRSALVRWETVKIPMMRLVKWRAVAG